MKLFRKKAAWLPTRYGLLALAAVFILLFLALTAGLYPFLAHSRPLPDASVMILEGWMGDQELADALALSESNTLFVVSGGPIEYGALLFKEKTYADATASRLVELGVPAQRILRAPAPPTQRDRTYVSAQAVRQAMEEADCFGTPANLVSVGVHSRRSGLLYRRVFGGDALGIISLESHRSDERHWWRTSEAFKKVVTELISWTYIQCTRWTY